MKLVYKRDALGRFLKGYKQPYNWNGRKRIKIKKVCPICQKSFKSWKREKRIYCSRECAYSSQERNDKIRKANKGRKSPLKGVPRSEITKKRIKKALKGKHLSSSTEFKKGKEHPFWKGGVEKNERNDPAYQLWVKKVKKRDDNTCQLKDENCFGYNIVHHIKNWSKYPKLRYKVNNGITLCQAHHPRGRAKEEQFEKLLLGLKPSGII